MKGFLEFGGCVEGASAVDCEGEGGIPFVCVNLFTRQ